ncbi:MAG: NAD(P)H-binding protein [Gemmatimonadota bacterium]
MVEGPFAPYPEEGEESSSTALAEQPEPLLEGPDRSHRVLVAGASGFLGRHLVPRLVARGHEVRGLARSRPTEGELATLGVEWWTGDVTDSTDLIGAAGDCDRVIHLAGDWVPPRAAPGAEGDGPDPEELHHGGTRNLLWEALDAGVERFVYVSALGARPDGAPFFRAKYAAEQEVRQADVESVVFRPAVTYGPGDRFTSDLREMILGLPLLPVYGGKAFYLQPVAIEDVVEVLCQSVERSGFGAEVFELGGPEPLGFPEIVDAVARAVGARTRITEVPAALEGAIARAARLLGRPEPWSADRYRRLRESGLLAGPEHALRAVFRLEPMPFRDVVADYL